MGENHDEKAGGLLTLPTFPSRHRVLGLREILASTVAKFVVVVHFPFPTRTLWV